jgi:hypothetical protein
MATEHCHPYRRSVMHGRRKRLATGQVVVEFALLCAALSVALFYPFVNNTSVAQMLWHSLIAVFRMQSVLLSIM